MNEEELNRKVKKVQEYADTLLKLSGMSKETAFLMGPDNPRTAFYEGMAQAYDLASSGVRIRVMESEDHRS